jgi:hypothetical protein
MSGSGGNPLTCNTVLVHPELSRGAGVLNRLSVGHIANAPAVAIPL